MIVDKYSTGLNPNEINYMRNIFGICDLDVKLSSCCKILFNELKGLSLHKIAIIRFVSVV
jgi:hypothetical protein